MRPFVDRSHVSVWRWVERLPGFRRVFRAGCRVSLFLVDETAVIVKGLMAWVWVAYEPLDSGYHGIGTAYRLGYSWRVL
ncbi:MAG: hypothetical protein QXH35_03585 [Nitrososphaerota archaeon]